MSKFYRSLIITAVFSLYTVFSLGLFNSPVCAAGFINGPGIVPIKHSVKGKIESQVAVIKVDQVFVNNSGHTQNCTYSFPLPVDAGVTSFSYWVDGRKIDGSVKEKSAAAREYHQAARSNRTAALGSISQNSGSVSDTAYQNLFTMNISSLEPNETRKVELVYSQVLPYSEGKVSFNYPLLNKFRNSRLHARDITLDIEIITSRNVKKVWTGIDTLDIVQESEKNFRLYYEGAFDFTVPELNIYYELFSKEMGFTCLSDKEHFMMTLAPQEDVDESQKLSKHVTFVIDTSGSMRGSKLNSTKQAFARFVSDLEERDFFSIYTFSTGYSTYHEKPLAASHENRQNAVQYIDTLMARGGTNIYDTLETVLSKPMTADIELVVFMTDGDPSAGKTCNMDSINRMVKENINERRMSVFGLGNDLRTEFLKSMAENGRGLFASVKDGADLKVELERLAAAIAVPLLSDIQVSISGNNIETFDIYPKDMPVLYKGTQMIISGCKRGSGDIKVRFTALQKNGRKLEMVYDADFEDHDRYGFTGAVWARKKVKALLSSYDAASMDRKSLYIAKKAKMEKIKKEVVLLATKYNIATPFTSFTATGPARPAKSVARNTGNTRKTFIHSSSKSRVKNVSVKAPSRVIRAAAPSSVNQAPAYRPARRKVTTAPIPFFPLFIPNFSKARRQSRVKACVSNMRTLEGAIEMYQMDHNGPIPDDIFERLVNEKYIKRMPECKSHGQYMVMANDGSCELVCSQHGTVNNYHSATGSSSYHYAKEGPVERAFWDSFYMFLNASNAWIGVVSTLLILASPFLYFMNVKMTLASFVYITLLPYIFPVHIICSLIKWSFNAVMGSTSKNRVFQSKPVYTDMPANA